MLLSEIVTRVRMSLRDTDPDANELLGDLEFTDDEVKLAATFCLEEWNETPPLTALHTSIETFPHNYHLTVGTTAHLLTMAAARDRRNNLTYTAGGVSVNDHAKFQTYEAKADQLFAKFNEFMIRTKTSENLQSCWGSV